MKVYLPGEFLDDWLPARESWETDIDYHRTRGDLWTPMHTAAVMESTFAKIDAGTRVRRGRGHSTVVDLTVDEARFMRGEADYRREYWDLNKRYGDDYYAKARAAAARLVEQLDAKLAKVAA